MKAWTQSEAIALCCRIEKVCPAFGCHVALTGGLLYKVGERKDLDILFYRIRQVAEIDVDGLFGALGWLGMERITTTSGFVIKAKYHGLPIDCMFPEVESGDYTNEAADPSGPGVDHAFAEIGDIP